MLRCRATSASLKETATREQRHDGKHLGGGSQLNDGEKVGKVVSQHVASHRDGTLTSRSTLGGVAHSLNWWLDLNLQARSVVVSEVLIHLLNECRVVRTV